MRVTASPVNLLFALLLMFAMPVMSQTSAPFSCFNAQEIRFPLGGNDFSKSEVLMNETHMNALYYLYQDKYSFWYKFVADEDVEIQFSVSASNVEDRYRAVAFTNVSDDFCDKLVNEGVDPMVLARAPIFTEDGIIYKNVLKAKKGEVFYISVLSLNRDDCGHFLYIEANNEKISFHAIHKPCYNFGFLEAPDFSSAKLISEDVDLEMVFDSPEPIDEFSAITTIEVEKKEETVVSVGDKLILNNVLFYNNTYALKPEADAELNQLLVFLQVNTEVELEIQGHAANNTEDIQPDPNFKGQGKNWNFKGSAFELSEKRAEAVRTFLIENGIDKSRLSAKGYGDTQKRVKNATTFEESEKNMRVEALITKQ